MALALVHYCRVVRMVLHIDASMSSITNVKLSAQDEWPLAGLEGSCKLRLLLHNVVADV